MNKLFIQAVHNYVAETNLVPEVCMVTAIVVSQLSDSSGGILTGLWPSRPGLVSQQKEKSLLSSKTPRPTLDPPPPTLH
jgi:hypothetical protein